jgi:hypothetical protein
MGVSACRLSLLETVCGYTVARKKCISKIRCNRQCSKEIEDM